ncbi:unnamed protein product, partial [Brassica oleracea]|uniref:(rape) hypothetical protein n=1 Tax=Brassica napus TaxID=3708 RepID=A0A816K7J3_BRANA|nr:unnamed protein product [Brassica napus]
MGNQFLIGEASSKIFFTRVTSTCNRVLLWLTGMEIELPKRIAKAGAEHHVDKINNTCRLTVLRLLKKQLED